METYVVFTLFGAVLGLLIDCGQGRISTTPTAKRATQSRTIKIKLNTQPKRPKKEIANLGGTVVYREQPPASPPRSSTQPKQETAVPPSTPATKPPSAPTPSASPPPPLPEPNWVKSETGFGNAGGMIIYKKRPTPTKTTPAPQPSATPPPQSSLSVPSTFHPSMLREEVEIPTSLLFKLDRYTYNRKLSERLVRQVAEKNPGKSGQWCAEKALWDLERDRK
ncbi:hypothetical protein [Pseudanabaena sp. FACHB-2040]|uniref:hypothetical protein n=1 Tax=Pseudanabaena sp. FACHB-2040 TaxID=2692859 RepID=UPI00168735E5|nr:hypothetical protein [Pseudanabaena sp. FACHB-2040]MBD2258881.1 hypothetical protein [Pseudanabaena sp. FACHB-2040]